MLCELSRPLYDALAQRPGLQRQCPAAGNYRWLLEEFRVSLFAQALGTSQPVSQKRLQEQWRDIAAWLQQNPL